MSQIPITGAISERWQNGEELSDVDETALYHYYELDYTSPNTESGRRLARR